VPYILGIAHPTGFPAFTLTGWLFSHAFALGTVAWRLNVFSGLWVSAAVAGVALLAQRLGAGPTEACLAAIAFAFGKQAWFQGTHADVHAMLLACMIFALLFAVRHLQGTERDGRDILRAGLCAGVGLATHPLALFVLPALAAALVMRRERLRPDLPVTVAALVAPLLLYLYLPLRSAYVAAHGLDPTAAAPLFGTGTVAWDTEHPRTLAGFIAEVTGRQFHATSNFVTAFGPHRYLAALGDMWAYVPSELAPWLVVLAAFGAAAVALRDLRCLVALAATPLCIGAFTSTVFTDPVDVARYLLPAFAVVIVFAAVAPQLPIPPMPRFALRIVVVLLLAAAVATAWQSSPVVRGVPDDRDGQVAIDAVRTAVPDGSLVVASWSDATALAYGAFVEHALGSRIVVLGWPSDFTDAYARWTRTRRVVILANAYGVHNLIGSHIPRSWLHPLPSPSYRYEIVEVRP